MNIKQTKPKRLGRGSWEKDGNLFESKYWVAASLLSNLIEPSAVKVGKKFTNETIDKVVDVLKIWYPDEPFTREKVAVYVNASATNEAIINKDETVIRTQNYHAQLDRYRKGLAELAK
jgi:hypothetical protein